MRKKPPTAQWKVYLDATLAARVEMLLWDATLQKPKYSERSKLIEALLTEWLEQQANIGVAR
jgi:hypothetical protein